MNNVKFVALAAITISTPTISFLSNSDFTTNSCYECEFITNASAGNDINLFKISLQNEYLTNSSFSNCINPITATYTSYEVENVDSEKRENFDILDSFKLLENDWDECGAIAPKIEIIELVKILVEQLRIQPEIFPTPDGGIQLEYAIGRNQHLNIEVISEQKINIFEMYTDRTYKEESMKFDIEYIKRRIDKFYDCV